ncbi:DUF2790 domain-containing protein [Stutzerimonas nosocomialis]|nr:DUF2790 domain-containing protein [Stutzerimonas nosocomialis]TLX53604.1 DUF2790 domain-containing protein [Stutzerimonas nosocomialis]TLX55597.1 DUF2790 domain-containing protein [Stutzerimonas nosocomialis]
MNVNTRNFVTAAMLSLTALCASIAHADGASETEATRYRYGMPLDIAKVVSIQEPSTRFCQVVTSEMTYIDSAGQRNAIAYRKLADVCGSQN